MTLLEAALGYAERGWFVFPCEPGEKRPVGGRGHLDASVDPQQIRTWWTQNPQANIGIAVAPSGLVVLDVDTAEGKPGLQSLSEIDAQLPDTLTARTGRGGYHGVYLRPDGMPAQRRVGFKPGLDLLGDGYFVASPSVLTNGQQYRWERLIQPVPLPPILRDVSTAPKVQPKVEHTGSKIESGGRNNSMFKLACALRDTGIGAEALARACDAENKQRFNPPLPDAELATIVNSALTTVQVRRDVALGAVVEQEIHEMFATPPAPSRSEWLEVVSKQPQPPVLFYSTGFPTLDDLLKGGFATRQLTGVIGPPSAGKSALVGEWLLTLAKHRPVLHVSLELMKHELFVRYAAHQMEFPWVDGIQGRVDQGAMSSSVKGIRIKLLGADDIDRAAPFECIAAEAEKIKQECGIAPIIAVDYIQLMARGAGSDTRSRVGELTMRARQLAQDLDTVVLGVFTTQRTSYSNKKGEEQMRAANDPTAYLGAAKESGDIEFDCAVLMYLDVDKLCEGATKPARIAVARVRVGNIGFVGVRARLDIGSFTDDPSALEEFASEERAAKRDDESMETVKQKLLEAIGAMPGRAWRDIQAKVASYRGIQRTQVDRARNALIGDGVIEKVVRYDTTNRKIPGDQYEIRIPPSTDRND